MNVLACSLVALALAGSPAGERRVETTVQDDAVLLYAPAALVERSMRRIVGLGADRVRLTAGWSAIAPAPRARRRPGGPFDAADSRTYPAEGWQRLDRAVTAAERAGLKVQIDLAFWAPRWAVARGGRDRDRERIVPDAGEFGRFALAAARRYDGAHPDPAHPHERLPVVRMWTTWNEPNNPTFLEPQWRRRGRRVTPYSPHVYRGLHTAAYGALKSVSRRNVVLVGGTAATGSRRPGYGGVPPLRFLRELACVDERLAPLRVPECRGFTTLPADGFAHHPYSRFSTPGAGDTFYDNAPISELPRLSKLLDDLAARGRTPGRLPLYLTEYGYETNPPDPTARFTPDDQARFMGWSTYLAQREPGVRMFAQFLLRDIDPASAGVRPGDPRYWSDFQSGLLYADGRDKPAARAFRTPFYSEVREVAGRLVLVFFGGVRDLRRPQLVRIERRDEPGKPWHPVQVSGPTCDSSSLEFLTDDDGFFERTAPYPGAGTYRMSVLGAEGRYEPSAEFQVGPELGAGAGARPGVRVSRAP